MREDFAMPQPDEIAQSPSSQQEAPPPDPIWAGPSTWDLAASPSTLDLAVRGWRAQVTRVSSAQVLVDDEASALIRDRAWEGETADRYQNHRLRLTGDMGDLGTALTDAAEALEQIAATLR